MLINDDLKDCIEHLSRDIEICKKMLEESKEQNFVLTSLLSEQEKILEQLKILKIFNEHLEVDVDITDDDFGGHIKDIIFKFNKYKIKFKNEDDEIAIFKWSQDNQRGVGW